MIDEHRIKHLEFIQGVVNRLSTNSFLLKGWTVVIVTALLSFSVSENSTALGLFAFVPLVMFWGLDGYFLWEERKYRKHYDSVRTGSTVPVDFSMNASSYSKETGGWLGATLSKTLVIFHGVILITIAAATIYQAGATEWLSGSSSASTMETTIGERAKSEISE